MISRYDPIKNCFVLKDLMPPPIINAFHPDYIKTYHPEMLIKQDVTGRENGMFKIGNKVDVKPRDFHMYSKAGTANVTPKGKKNVAIPNT